MKKIAGVYSLIIGFAILSLWTILLMSGQVPELATEPLSIFFHITAEMIMAVLLMICSIGFLKNKNWSTKLFQVTSGLVIYSVINSAGYYAQNGNLVMVALFMVLLISTVLILMRL